MSEAGMRDLGVRRFALSVAASVAAALVTGLAGVFFSTNAIIARYDERIKGIEAGITEHKARYEAMRRADIDRERRIARNEANVERLLQMLPEMQKDIKQLLRNGAR